MMAIIGCGGPSTPKIKIPIDKPSKEGEPDTQRINSGAGTMTRSEKYNPNEDKEVPPNPDKKRPYKLWIINWKSVQLALSNGNAIGGTMKEVDGQMFEKGEEASTFEAQGADADKETNTLKLWGKVTVRSKEQDITLTCDKLTWHADRKVLEATGEVLVVGKDYTMGPFDRLLCSPKLQYVSTPDLFKEPK